MPEDKKTGPSEIVLKPAPAAAVKAPASTAGGGTELAAAAAPAKGGCTEFSVSFALLTSDNNRQVSFGVTRGCLDAHTPLYVISFLLRDKVDGEFQDRVRLLVTVGPESNDKAQAIIDRGLRSTQKNFLEGAITTKAKTVVPGTTEQTPQGAAIAADLTKVLTK
jgi:hypothetical protein